MFNERDSQRITGDRAPSATGELKLLVAYAHGLDDTLNPEEIEDIKAGKAEIARGEWVDWDDLKRELNL